jgi:hypothetical protein
MGHDGIGARRRPLRRRSFARWPYVVAVTVVVGCTIAASAMAASRNAKITATWNCCGGGGAAVQYWTVSETASGSLSGSARTATTVFAKISGSVTGHKLRLVTTYNSFSPGYVATFVGKIGTFGLRMSGTWTSNRGQSGRWTALRAKKARKKK